MYQPCLGGVNPKALTDVPQGGCVFMNVLENSGFILNCTLCLPDLCLEIANLGPLSSALLPTSTEPMVKALSILPYFL